MVLDKRAWRCQKGYGAQEKGHGTAPCYFALDLTLQVQGHKIKEIMEPCARPSLKEYTCTR